MKQITFNILDAIRRGIIRIFPNASLTWLTLCTAAILLIACSTPKQVTQLVHDIQHDTIYLSSHQYDSVYIYKDRLTDRSRDTVYLKDVSIEYRYKFLRDTIYKVLHDSIPYEVTITEVKEITRPLTLYDRICRTCFWFVIGALAFRLYRKFNYILF